MVGFGGGDTPDAGRAFVEKHGLSFEMLYDEDRSVWNELGFSSQPAWALYDANGVELGRGAGALDPDRVRALLN